MAAPMNILSESLLQKSFAECTPAEIAQLTEQYPYFAPAHFMLLKKLDPATEEYRRYYQKALLYYHDPVSFEFFLNRDIAVLPEEETASAPAPIELPDFGPTSIEEHAIATPEEELEAAETGDPDATDAPLPGLNEIDLNAPPTGDISFEPYHTVDYFASQGIKLSQADFGTDKFGKQLKSFTEWLKTMKRVQPTETTEAGNEHRSDARVEGMAGKSVRESEIVTESMAEVWLKQGNKAKAQEIYRKLSLLYPAKSAYFADKINTLND
ncbi:hypothetical protein EPD60_02325 [Flaviaesturariibacter flavus]|uniref:Tetratricopeptide repeat protein n=1 Tax=Flaviaesturariibacter flavus TaxID=2502780 RepID=A0A4R1BPW9_9BACT|nr:hypothetical protein [Flaviaesturariibacter flavus]TCJ19275.1 hypothetical protein EPD60_02325 [Flaviaesturariibacter flavus]